jgi:ribosomal protein S27AE
MAPSWIPEPEETDPGDLLRRLCPYCAVSFLTPVVDRSHVACIEMACPHCGSSVWVFSGRWDESAQAVMPDRWAPGPTGRTL